MAEAGRPTAATAVIGLMVVTGAFALALFVYLMFFGGNPFGGFLFLLLAVAYLPGARSLFRGESWGWGAGVFAGAFYILFGLAILPWGVIPIALAAAVIALLFRVREFYGMVRYDPEVEERKRQDLRTQRMANPEALHCPHCGSTALWMASDGSAFCDACKVGTIALRPPA